MTRVNISFVSVDISVILIISHKHVYRKNVSPVYKLILFCLFWDVTAYLRAKFSRKH